MILNLTPHTIRVLDEDGNCLATFPEGGAPIRLHATKVECEPIDGIPTVKTVFGKAKYLPQFQRDTFYIVSQLVKNRYPEREDLLVPVDVLKDYRGMSIGCRALGR